MNYTKLIIRDLQLNMSIGVYPDEKIGHQPVLINVEAHIETPADGWQDSYAKVVCYDKIKRSICALAAEGHIHLAETLAEGIAAICLDTKGVTSVKVRVEKTNISADVAALGIEIYRASA